MGIEFAASSSGFSFWIRSLTFSDGSTIELKPGATFILTGPNSSGKSASLREIQQHLQHEGQPTGSQQPACYAVTEVTFRFEGTAHQLANWLRRRYPSSWRGGLEFFQLVNLPQSGSPNPHGTGLAVEQPNFSLTPQTVASLSHTLTLRLDTQSRLSIASTGSAGKYSTKPETYIHLLQRDGCLAEELSNVVSSAFNHRLIINFGGGASLVSRWGGAAKDFRR